MSRRCLALLMAAGALLLAGCGSISYGLPGHDAQRLGVPVALHVGDRILALETPRPLPVPGGFRLGLASEDPAIVAVEVVETGGGGASLHLRARRPGRVTLHYVNRFALPADLSAPIDRATLQAASLSAFEVTVSP